MEWLLACERQYFQAIHGAHTVWQDRLMYAFTGAGAWITLLLFPLYCAVRRRRDWVSALLCTLTGVAASLTVAEGLIKPFFKRLRPTHHPAFMQEVAIVNDYIASGDYGFISGHSTTAFAFAVMSALAAKNLRPATWASKESCTAVSPPRTGGAARSVPIKARWRTAPPLPPLQRLPRGMSSVLSPRTFFGRTAR